MNKKPIIAGNWKMNGSRGSVAALLKGLTAGLAEQPLDPVELVVCPPFVFLEQCEEALANTAIRLGAQDVCEQAGPGAYTGEISADMLRDFSCTYVIVGHSERRRLYGETPTRVAEKFYTVLRAKMVPILCVGETEDERKAGKTQAVIQEQLAAVLQMHDNCALQNGLIAYEPVWAIGTGKEASGEQAETVHAMIRAQVHATHPEWAKSLRILYGGSVTPDNAKDLLKMPNIAGVLVGGASLSYEKFLKIGEQCKQLF